MVANLGIKAHAHMLRHACGFKLANDGSLQAYLGHRNIPEYDAVHSAGAGSVQGLLAGLVALDRQEAGTARDLQPRASLSCLTE